MGDPVDTSEFKPGRLNLVFVAVAIIYVEFGALIFPLIQHFLSRLGENMPVPTQIAFIQGLAIKMYPLATLGFFAVCYVLLLAIGNARIRSAVNTSLLYYFAFLLIALGLPIVDTLV